MDLLLFLQAATDATVASAANAAADRWTYENIKDFTGYILGLLIAAFLAWQNQIIVRQNVVHEERAEVRAAKRGDPPVEYEKFPGARH